MGKKETEESEPEREAVVRKTELAVAGFGHGRMPTADEIGQPAPGNWTGKEIDSLLGPPEEHSPAGILTLAQCHAFWNSDLQNCRIINLC